LETTSLGASSGSPATVSTTQDLISHSVVGAQMTGLGATGFGVLLTLIRGMRGMCITAGNAKNDASPRARNAKISKTLPIARQSVINDRDKLLYLIWYAVPARTISLPRC
jgi:hypothetical protein